MPSAVLCVQLVKARGAWVAYLNEGRRGALLQHLNINRITQLHPGCRIACPELAEGTPGVFGVKHPVSKDNRGLKTAILRNSS